MPTLVPPDVGRHGAWLEAHREWGPGLHEDGFGLGVDDEVDSAGGFARWVARLSSGTGRAWWIVEGEAVLGGIGLRSADDPRVVELGHVGFGVRPSARGRGVASWALRQVLLNAGNLGIDPVLLVCRDDNPGSIATIERCGAELARVEPRGPVLLRRYTVSRLGPPRAGVGSSTRSG